jgi:hypothetical protein
LQLLNDNDEIKLEDFLTQYKEKSLRALENRDQLKEQQNTSPNKSKQLNELSEKFEKLDLSCSINKTCICSDEAMMLHLHLTM